MLHTKPVSHPYGCLTEHSCTCIIRYAVIVPDEATTAGDEGQTDNEQGHTDDELYRGRSSSNRLFPAPVTPSFDLLEMAAAATGREVRYSPGM